MKDIGIIIIFNIINMLESHQIDLHDIQVEYLNKINEKYQINDIGKTIRCLINYSLQ